jgi:hypothetical protein
MRSYHRLPKQASVESSARFFAFLGFGSRLRGISLLVFLSVVAYFLFVSNYFLVQYIELSGNQEVSREEIEQTLRDLGQSRRFLVPKNHFLVLNREEGIRFLQHSFPQIATVEQWEKRFPNMLRLTIREQRGVLLWESDGKTYLFGEGGLVLAEVPQDKVADFALPRIVDLGAGERSIGEQIPLQQFIGTVDELTRKFSGRAGTNITVWKTNGISGKELYLETEEGWTVYFTTTRNIDRQLLELSLILSQEIKPDQRGRLAYIDLRFSPQAYYCFHASPCAATVIGREPPAPEAPADQTPAESSWRNKLHFAFLAVTVSP